MTLVIPQDMKVVEDPSFDFHLQSDTAAVMCLTAVDDLFSGASIYLLTPEEIIADLQMGFENNLVNPAAEKVSFGKMDAYRITASFMSLPIVFYTYLDGNTLCMVSLTSIDGDTLEVMADNFQFNGYTAK